MDAWEIVLKFWMWFEKILLVGVPVISAIITVRIYRHTVNRESKILTLEHLSQIREKYPNKVPARQRLEYLRDMEFFCTGINEGIYDIRIVKKMSGRRLLRQYDSYMRNYITLRRKASTSDESWMEYECVMEKLRVLYSCRCRGWRRYFCPKYK